MSGPIGVPLFEVRIENCSACGRDHNGLAVVQGRDPDTYVAACPDNQVTIEITFLPEVLP